MTRAAVLALAAACSAPAAPRITPAVVVPIAAAPIAAAPVAPAPAAPVVRTDAPGGGIEAPTGGTIRIVAATPDGGAVLTADDLHEVRLWPALDGSQEPRIVELPEPHELALGRRGDGYTAAVLDAAGGLYLASLDAQGRNRTHVSLAGDPAYLGIAMSSRGLLAWRADQTLVLLDGDGAALATLATAPGERIVDVAVAGARVAVLLERDGKRGVRTVVVDRPAWGAWIDLASDAADLIAIAPSGRLAVRDHQTAVVLDAGGKLVTKLAGAAGDALALFDDTHVVMSNGGTLTWLTAGEHAAQTRDAITAGVVVAGGHAISAGNGDVVLATPGDTLFLGYDLDAPAVVQAAGDGQLVIGVSAKFYALDAQLRVAGSPGLPLAATIPDLRWLGGDAWLVETLEPGDDHAAVRLVEGSHTTVVRKDLRVAHVLGYEPSTHLVTLSLGEAPGVYRYDPDRHLLAPVATVRGGGDYAQTELFPLAPAQAGGAQLLHVTMRDATTVAWVPDAAKLARPSAKVTFAGSLAAADAAGHAYGWVSTSAGNELAVFRDGKRTGTLPADGPVSVWPDRTGARIVEISTHAVSLLTGDGKRVWTKQVEHATEALWTSDGGLALVTAAGIARLDVATGAVAAARCGWGFGLTAVPHAPPPHVEPVCAQLERGD